METFYMKNKTKKGGSVKRTSWFQPETLDNVVKKPMILISKISAVGPIITDSETMIVETGRHYFEIYFDGHKVDSDYEFIDNQEFIDNGDDEFLLEYQALSKAKAAHAWLKHMMGIMEIENVELPI